MNENLNNKNVGQVPTPQQPEYATPTIQTQQQRDERIHMARAVVNEETKAQEDNTTIEQQLGATPNINANVGQPQVAASAVAPTPEISNEISQDNILDSITLDSDDVNEQSGDAESVTFDYDSLYGDNGEVKDIEVEPEDESNKPVFTATDLDIQNRSLTDRAKTDIAPEFNINALDNSATGEDAKLQGNILSEKQQDRADTRRRIMFILGLVIVLIIAVKFIFPFIMNHF